MMQRRHARRTLAPVAIDPLSFEPYFQQLTHYHRNLCPRQVSGVRMGLHAAEILDLEPRQRFATVETDGSFADAISVATGCWLG
jgi:formylmethanofuran dehydrogenase subunit E